MDRRYCAFLYRDGNICQGSNGVAFEGQPPVGVIIREGINFEGLKQLIIQKLCLGDSEEVDKIIYRMPVSLSPLLYGVLYLQNDEHVEMMMMTHNVYATVINVMELLVETRAFRFQVDLNIESQSLLEDVPLSIPSWSQPEMPSAYYQPDINFDNTPNIEVTRGLMTTATISPPHVRDDIGCSSRQTRIDVADDEALSFDSDFVPDVVSEFSSVSGYSEGDDDGSEDDWNEDNDDDEGRQEAEEDNDDGVQEADAIGPQVVREYHERAARFMSNIRVERLVETDNLFAETESVGVELAEGALFPTKEDLRHAVKMYSIRMHRQFRVNKTSARYIDYRCINYPTTCGWRVRACKRQMYWEITRYGGAHACVNPALTQDHNKLDSDLIAHLIVNLVTEAPHTPVKSIRTMMNSEFGYNISYKKAWRAKHKAIALAFGNWESSYAMLPRWMAAMQRFMPGTVVEWETDDHPEDENLTVFRRVFWAYQQSIQGFEHVKPIVQVDGTFLYGKYKGALLMATSQDGDRKCFPLAFALVEGETGEAWHFFLRHLRAHVVGTRRVCLISDRHGEILSSVEDVNILWQPPYAQHVFCTRHLASNLHSEYKKKWLKKLFINMSYEPRRHVVDSLLGELRLMFSDAAEWIDNIPKETMNSHIPATLPPIHV
ncbi:uncharacterized protein G2W53_031939 [Senna tora]|uniref:Transposase n=1 Tax=Senna tora TaxID=362788 RepID=A0A834W790_9FABA|nr:uncharacterized protein G2W53_031939 [Senna tora]